MAQPFVLDVNLRIVPPLLGLNKVKQQLAGLQIGGIGKADQLATNIKKVGTSASSTAIHVAKANKATRAMGQNLQVVGNRASSAAKQVQGFGSQVAIAGKRYAAFIVATAAAFKVVQFVGAGTKAVIEFDQAMVSLSQILKTSVGDLGGLSQQFLDLSVATGTSASEIANAAKLLAQAGFRGSELTEAISQLAKVPLTPIFESMEQAVDGAIAAMRQFSNEGLTVETVFDKMIAVSNQYAASFPDIIEGLKRGGSAFQAIGGTLDEFIAAFTTIRSVTRESASAVGTSLKTLSTRLADPKIIAFLETKNIRLIEKGQFVGPLEALKRIGTVMENTIAIQDKLTIAVKLGGRRQVSRFLALSQNQEKNNEILETSKNAYGAFSKVAQQGLKAIGKQIDIIVAKAKKLAIELGEDLFIPFIEGITGATDAVLSLLTVLKPIIPILTKIGVLAAGVAISGGIGGFIGPKLGSLAGPAAFAAAGGGLKGAGAGIAASPFVQAGLLLAAAEVAASFVKTADGADTFTSTLLTSTALVTAAISLFRKQTILQLAAGGGLLPRLGKVGGAIATIGAIALPIALIQSAKSASELAEKIVESATKSVSEIEIDPTDPASIQQGIGDLYDVLGQSIEDLKEQADVRTNFSIAKSFRGVGRALGNALEGNFGALITRGGLADSDVENQIQAILKQSPKIIEGLIQSVANSLIIDGVVDTSPHIERGTLVKQTLEGGATFKGANVFASAVIESVGGIDIWEKRVRESAVIIKAEADKRGKLLSLIRSFVPPQLIGQLLQFSKAVDKTSRAITVSADLFSTQVAELGGGINAPAFAFNFETEQIKKFIASDSLKDIFAFTPDIPKFVGGITDIENLLDQFIINVSNLPTDANTLIEVDKFLDFQNVPIDIRANFSEFFETVSEEILAASEGSVITAGEIKSRFQKEFANIGLGASDVAVDTVTKYLQSTFSRIQDELNRLATIRRLELDVGVRPSTQANFLREQLRRSGIQAPGVGGRDQPIRGTLAELELIRTERIGRGRLDGGAGLLPTPEAGFFQGRGQDLASIAGDESVRQQVRDSFQRLTISLSEARKELSELRPSAEGFTDASNRAKELARQVVELQVSMTALDQATGQAAQTELETLKLRQTFEIRQRQLRLESQGGDPIRAQRIIFDLQQEHLLKQFELQDKFDSIIEKDRALRASLAKEISVINQAEGQEFHKSVSTFGDATRIQLSVAELMRTNISSFGQAIIDFRNTGAQQPLGGDNAPTMTPNQIITGAVNIPQAFAELNRLMNETDSTEKAQLDILNAIHARQEQLPLQQTQQEPVATRQEQEGGVEIGERMGLLTESLDSLLVALNEPNEVRLVTDQHIDIDLSALPSDITAEIKPILEEAVLVAARTVARKAMESLAAKGGSELSIAATDTAQELV